MNPTTKKILFTAVIALVTLTLLWQGRTLWSHFALLKPVEQSLAGINGIKEFHWEKNSPASPAKLNITIEQADNLAITYTAVTGILDRTLGADGWQIVIRDHRSPALEQRYWSLQYPIQESIFTGNFTLMATRVQAGARGAVYVDNRNIYLQLSRDGAELYAVIPRQSGGASQNETF